MRKFACLFACFTLLVPASSFAAAAKHPVLMISIDGLRPDAITEADQHGLSVPNLRMFLKEGTYAEGVIGVVPTLTYPSHTTLVTGVAPAVHGIDSNTTFDPLFRNQVGWYWYAEQLHAETLWQAAKSKGLKTASLNWPVTVDAPGIDQNLPEYWRASTADDLMLLRALARPLGLEQHLEQKLGPYVDGNTLTIAADQTRTQFAEAMLREYHPDLFTVHLSALDEEEHRSAPFSPASNKTLEAMDGMIGSLRETAMRLNPHTVVVVVSDHGFARTDYRVNLFVPLLQAGLLTAGSTSGPAGLSQGLTSWKATLWPAGGSAAVMLKDPNDTESLARIMKILRGLAADPANGIETILTREELRSMGGFPGAEALVVLRPPFQMGYSLSGPLITAAPSTGMHGYLPTNPEMRSSFFAWGDTVAQGRNLHLIDMRQVAPAIAHILGASLEGASLPILPLS